MDYCSLITVVDLVLQRNIFIFFVALTYKFRNHDGFEITRIIPELFRQP